jgi:hypothetical protein
MNGESVIKSGSIAYDAFITSENIPSDPTKEGYTFNGWDGVIPERMPAHSITLRAQWSTNEYKITYRSTQ